MLCDCENAVLSSAFVPHTGECFVCFPRDAKLIFSLCSEELIDSILESEQGEGSLLAVTEQLSTVMKEISGLKNMLSSPDSKVNK